MASTLVLSGSDIGIVAVMRELGATAQIGLVLAVWGLGSLVGGLLYGALARSVSAFWLLAGLALMTLPMALASSTWGLAVFAFVAGLLCAPTITASVDTASRLVPAEARGEAMGWHGSFLTSGGALGAPIAGIAIDRLRCGCRVRRRRPHRAPRRRGRPGRHPGAGEGARGPAACTSVTDGPTAGARHRVGATGYRVIDRAGDATLAG